MFHMERRSRNTRIIIIVIIIIIIIIIIIVVIIIIIIIMCIKLHHNFVIWMGSMEISCHDLCLACWLASTWWSVLRGTKFIIGDNKKKKKM